MSLPWDVHDKKENWPKEKEAFLSLGSGSELYLETGLLKPLQLWARQNWFSVTCGGGSWAKTGERGKKNLATSSDQLEIRVVM